MWGLRPRCAGKTLVEVESLSRGPVGLPAVGDHLRARLDVVGEEHAQRIGRGIRKRGHATAAEASGLGALDGDPDEHLLLASRAPAGEPRLLAAEDGLIDLDFARQALAAGPHEHRANPVQHRPRGLVGADLELALERQRRDTVLLGGKQPDGGEPDRERGTGAVEDRPRRNRRALTAGCALQPPVRHPPPAGVPAVRADEPIRPPQPLEVVQAVGVGAKPRLELAERARVVPSSLGTGDGGILGRLDGYPTAR